MLEVFLAQVNLQLFNTSPEFELEWLQLPRAFYTKPLHIIEPDLKLLLVVFLALEEPEPRLVPFSGKTTFLAT